MDHPEIANQLRNFFAPPAGNFAPAVVPTMAGPPVLDVNPLQGCTLKVRSSEDNEKDNMTKIGKTRCKLYLIGAAADFAEGTISGFSYPILSAGLNTVHS